MCLQVLTAKSISALPPKNINDSEIAEAGLEPPHSKPNTTFTDTSLQLILHGSFLQRLAIARLLNHFRSKPLYEDILHLSSEVLQVIGDAIRLLQTFRTLLSSTRLTFYINFYQLSVRRFLLALHLPFAVKGRKDPHFYFSRKVCTEQAFIISTPQDNEDFWRLISVGTYCILYSYLALGFFKHLSSGHCLYGWKALASQTWTFRR